MLKIFVIFTLVLGPALFAESFHPEPVNKPKNAKSVVKQTRPAFTGPGHRLGGESTMDMIEDETNRNPVAVASPNRGRTAIKEDDWAAIRQQQDLEYQEALILDQKKEQRLEAERLAREAEEQAREAEQMRVKIFHERLDKLRHEVALMLPSEPTSNQDAVRVVFKLPNGSRFIRSFNKLDKLHYLHWFVFSRAESPYQFELATNYPRRNLPGRSPLPEDLERGANSKSIESSPTMAEFGLGRSETMLVVDLES